MLFEFQSVTGVWALQLEDANCVTLNHKYKLIAFGRKNAEGIVYNVDEMTGGLVISHRLRLPTRDYPGCPGPISCMKWTPDGTALVMAWQRGGFSIWSLLRLHTFVPFLFSFVMDQDQYRDKVKTKT